MTLKEAEDLISEETKKHSALLAIVKILDTLDGDQTEWIMERLNDE